jgi:hypothetical protein
MEQAHKQPLQQHNAPEHHQNHPKQHHACYGTAAAFFTTHKRETHTIQAAAIIAAASSFQLNPSKGGQI